MSLYHELKHRNIMERIGEMPPAPGVIYEFPSD
jgi:hypothetical protein